MTANPWGNVPDDFVIPVPTAARLLKVAEQDLYAGVLNGLYVLLAPNDRWWSLSSLVSDPEDGPIEGPPPEILRASGHWLLGGDVTDTLYTFPRWLDVGEYVLLQWLADGTILQGLHIYEGGAPVPMLWHLASPDYPSSSQKDPPPLKPPFLGMLGALFNRIKREGFPPKPPAPGVVTIAEPPMPRNNRGAETQRAIVQALLELADCRGLSNAPTEAAVKTSRLYKAVCERLGAEVTPKTVSNHLYRLLGKSEGK
jgi:hypothetical protein